MECFRKKLKENILKKAYSDHELNAAVEAIKSGSIGTRKAAQMFGVPRSTLRNKVLLSHVHRHLDQWSNVKS